MSYRDALNALVKMSAYAGGRFDLVQAGGGNTSVKLGNRMYIKASGYLLSELTHDKGYTGVKIDEVLSILEDKEVLNTSNKKEKDSIASKRLQSAMIMEGPRPSIETYLHALLYKYTLHVHSISVNLFTSHKNWLQKMKELDNKALCVQYKTPGIELGIELKKQLKVYKKKHGVIPQVIFLQNHGMIISSDSIEEIEELNEKITFAAEEKSGIDLSRYRDTTKIANCYNESFHRNDIAYFSEDSTITKLLEEINHNLLKKPFSPDGYVFCGYTMFEIEELRVDIFQKYQKMYFEPPKIIWYNKRVYIMATDLKKAKMIEDVFKSNLLVVGSLKNELEFLEDSEIRYLGNWEAEKYRQNL